MIRHQPNPRPGPALSSTQAASLDNMRVDLVLGRAAPNAKCGTVAAHHRERQKRAAGSSVHMGRSSRRHRPPSASPGRLRHGHRPSDYSQVTILSLYSPRTIVVIIVFTDQSIHWPVASWFSNFASAYAS
eukprot:g50151.t1